MKFEIVKLPQLCGKRITVYSVVLLEETNDQTIFEKFLTENIDSFPNELADIRYQIENMANKTGIRDGFFEKPEGKAGQGVYALFDKHRKLRLYCMEFGSVVIILGGGGPKTTRTLQEDPKLKYENDIMRYVSDAITQRMKEKEISLPLDGTELQGNLLFEEDDPMKIE